MVPYPLLFEPMLKTKVWGGRTLERFGKTLPPGELVGESWELADLPGSIRDGRSRIINGPLKGQTLRDAIRDHGRAILGQASTSADGGFPLLIKYLDARQNLSVQVHPSRTYANVHPDSHLKSEAWVVIHADPGAVIYKGIKPGVTAAEFARHIQTNEVVDDLIAIPVQPGDCHYLPSGTCHALGAGILVAEVQTPSDTTFRVYDWGRPSGAGRELHIQQALECIDFGFQPPNPPNPYKPTFRDGLRITPLTETEYFRIDRVDSIDSTEWAIATLERPEVWMMVKGRGGIQPFGADLVDLESGATTLLPAALSPANQRATAQLDAGSWLLRITIP
jgi:mannose-6-phosphate isomerase